MKCTKCNTEQPPDQFYKSRKATSGRHSQCKTCVCAYQKRLYHDSTDRRSRMAENRRVRFERNKEYVVAYLRAHPCVDCGNTDIRVLEFDHRCPPDKLFGVGDAVRHAGLEAISAEIEKCDVRCANCHRIRTCQENGWYRAVA